MMSGGPSPLVPFLMVGLFGFLIFGPSLLAVMESILQIFQVEVFVMLILLLVTLVLFVLLLYVYFSPQSSYSLYLGTQPATGASGLDSDGFGLGSLLLVVLFFVLYGFM